ncbi:hypothetical protein [Streptomyces sp. NPDC002889]|uniref:hypothetical protein n=1 Tax=Streptomyces sp. NPDC002889 TaxID=3364669 RepID=UPI0036B673A6
MTTTQPATAVATSLAQVPGQFPPDVLARLEQIDRDATEHVEDNRPEKTKGLYAADCRAWEAFCAEACLPPLAVRSGTLVLFVEWCWVQPGYTPGLFLSPATIDRRLSGIVVTARRQHKLQLAADVAEEARALLKAKKKALKKAAEERGRGPAPALLVKHMLQIARTLPDDMWSRSKADGPRAARSCAGTARMTTDGKKMP